MAKVAETAAQQLPAQATGSAATGTAVHNAMEQESSAGTRTVGLVYDNAMEYHVREDHPEHPDRVRVLNERLQQAGLVDRCIKLPSKLATDEELLTCHSQEHIDKVTSLYNSAPDMRTDEGELLRLIGDTFIITGDIYCNMHTNIAARSAAGCATQAVESVLSGQVESAFAIVRPPGHHAEPSDYMGFCFFNNVAVAAHAALKHPDIQRVLILDWDIHHGNGTQKVFWEDDRVLFVSLHRRDKDFYPEGIGFATEVGEGAGRGYNVNVPWFETKMGDGDYMAAFELILEPIISQFDPQLVIISAGFDAAEGDFLGKCLVTPEGFSAMTAALMRHAGGKVVAVLEGGYVPSILGECAAAVLSRLLGDPAPPLPASALGAIRSKTGATLAKVDEQQRQFWTRLASQPPFESAFKMYKAQHQLAALCIGGSGRPSSGGMMTRRQGAGTAGKAGSQETDAGSSGAVSLATRAPRLSSASAAAKKAKAAPPATAAPAAAAAAAVDGVPAASPASTPTAAAAKRGGKGDTKAATPAAAAAAAPGLAMVSAAADGAHPAPAAATTGTQQVQPAAAAVSETASTTEPAASIPDPAAATPAAAAAAAPGGRKIRIKLAGKAASGDAQRPAPADTSAAAAASAGSSLSLAKAAEVPAAAAEVPAAAAAAAAAEQPMAATPGPKQAPPEPATLTNLTTPAPSSRKARTAATPAAIAAAAVTPVAAVSPVASEARATVAVAMPSSPPRMATTPVASSSMPAAAGPAGAPPAAAAAAAAGQAAGSAQAGLPGTPAALAAPAASSPAAAQASPAVSVPAMLDPYLGHEAVAGPAAAAPAAAPQPPALAAAAGPMDADVAMDDVLAPGTPAEYAVVQWYAAPAATAAAAAGAEGEGDDWAAMGSAQLEPPTPAAGAGLVDSLTADLLRLAVQEAAEVPLSP